MTKSRQQKLRIQIAKRRFEAAKRDDPISKEEEPEIEWRENTDNVQPVAEPDVTKSWWWGWFGF